MTQEEKTQLIREKKELLAQWKKEKNIFYNTEQAIKILLNSIYGCFGSEYFTFFKKDIAESITLQGQHLIRHSEKLLNRYFMEMWHKDTKLHEKIGVKIKEGAKVTKPVWIYTDTDSGYVAFDEPFSIIENLDDFDPKELVFLIVNNRLQDFLNRVFQKYADDHNTENYQDFEMESLSRNAIWIAKKNYMLNLAWEDGVDREDLSSIVVKGWDTVKSSTPSFCRKHLKELLIFIFSGNHTIDLIQNKVKDIKKQFKLARIEEISKNVRINNYEKYLINDTTAVEFKSGAPFNLKAAYLHNYTIQQSKYKNKYNLIASGDKVKLYAIKGVSAEINDFAYLPGYHPYEIAPEIDYEEQFNKTFLDPLNRVLNAMGLRELNSNLVFTKSLF